MVLANDTDPNGNALTVTAVGAPTGGTASVGSGGGYVIYTAPGAVGTYTFSYTISDGNGGTDSATVSVSVQAFEDPGCDPRSGDQCDIDP
jgi:hypothetical protein